MNRGLLLLTALAAVMAVLGVIAGLTRPEPGTVETLGTSAEGHVVKRVFAADRWHTFVEQPK